MPNNTFTFGGVCSDTYDIVYDTEFHSILPEQKKYVKEIPFLDGVVDFDVGGYGVRVISIKLYFTGDFADLRENRENIIAWLASTSGMAKQLVFDCEPTKYYMAKIYSAITFTNDPQSRDIGTVTFECNPPWQYQDGILLTPDVILWNTADSIEGSQYIKTFTSNSGSLRFRNSGTLAVKPKIYLIGYFTTSLLLKLGAQQWQYNGALAHDCIVIDCTSETVTRLSDGANLFGNVDPTKDDYFNLSHGNLEITLTGHGISTYPNNLTLIVEFEPQDLG